MPLQSKKQSNWSVQSASLQSSERKGADLETPQSPSGTLSLFALQIKDPPFKLALNPVPGLYFMYILHQPLLNLCHSQEQLSPGCFSDSLFIWVFPPLPIPPRDKFPTGKKFTNTRNSGCPCG